MERLIHNDYLVRLELNLEEAYNLFDAFHYYGKLNTLDAAEDMMISKHPLPLINHWEDFDEFLNVWDLFYKMSRELPRVSFAKVVVTCQIPSQFLLTEAQEEMFMNREEFQRQSCYLLSFFDSISDYFDYEVEMIKRGYPRAHNRAA